MGHVAVSDGAGGTVEAMDHKHGVAAGAVSGRRWDTGVLVPGIDYTRNGTVTTTAPAVIYFVGAPGLSAAKVTRIQQALASEGIDPGPIDGAYGTQTAAAVAAFQRVHGLLVDGEVGPKTATALGVTL
jgi:peptidoglycan hydrolase-like protein with peptidoglycan-binding domain